MNIRDRGDTTFLEYTARFDNFKVTNNVTLEISASAREAAFQYLPSSVRWFLERAANRIRDCHERQKALSWEHDDGYGSRLGQQLTSLERIGVYMSGGKAAYSSSLFIKTVSFLLIPGIERS